MTNPDAPQTTQHLQGAVTTTDHTESPMATYIRLRTQATEAYTILTSITETLDALRTDPFAGTRVHAATATQDVDELRKALGRTVNELTALGLTAPEPPGGA